MRDAGALRFGQQGKRGGHGFVEHLRAQAAAHNGDFQAALAFGKAAFGRGQGGDFGANRVAYQPVGVLRKGFGKGIQHARCPFGEPFVCHACHGVLLVHKNWHA